MDLSYSTHTLDSYLDKNMLKIKQHRIAFVNVIQSLILCSEKVIVGVVCGLVVFGPGAYDRFKFTFIS